MMHVTFDHSHMIVMCKSVVARLITGLYWTVAVLLVICRCTACSRLTLAHQCWCAQPTVSVVVPGRNWTLFRCILRSHYHVQSAVMLYFRCRRGLYALCKLMNTWHIYPARIGHTPNGSSALQHFERGNALEIRDGIMFDFYPGLPQVLTSTT